MSENSRCVSEAEFINNIEIWVMKQAAYPLELITFLYTDDGSRFIAMPDYSSGKNIFLGKKSYKNYQTSLTKVGAILDRIDYSELICMYKIGRPITCPIFCAGYEGYPGLSKPYPEDSEDALEWQQGYDYAYRVTLNRIH